MYAQPYHHACHACRHGTCSLVSQSLMCSSSSNCIAWLLNREARHDRKLPAPPPPALHVRLLLPRIFLPACRQRRHHLCVRTLRATCTLLPAVLRCGRLLRTSAPATLVCRTCYGSLTALLLPVPAQTPFCYAAPRLTTLHAPCCLLPACGSACALRAAYHAVRHLPSTAAPPAHTAAFTPRLYVPLPPATTRSCGRRVLPPRSTWIAGVRFTSGFLPVHYARILRHATMRTPPACACRAVVLPRTCHHLHRFTPRT